MDKIVIDLADPQVRGVIMFTTMLWGIAVLVVIYNLWDDIAALRRDRRKPQKERRFIEPCAGGMHSYEEGACTTCKAEEPPTTT